MQRAAATLLVWTATACLEAPPSGGDGGGIGSVQLVVPAGSVLADLEGYPLLISITASDALADGARDDAGDLVFRTRDDTITELPHEIEAWNPDTGALVAWVRVPQLYAGFDNELELAYGEVRETAADPSAVWSSYAGVWHMSDLSDAASAAEATSLGDVTKAEALIAGGHRFNGGHVVIGDPPDGHLDFGVDDSFTYSMWLQIASDSIDYQVLLSKGGTSQGNTGYSMETAPDGGWIYGCIADADVYACTTQDVSLTGNEWALVTLVVDREEDMMSLYLGAARLRTYDGIGDVDPDEDDNDHQMTLGSNETANFAIDGTIDEVRVSSGALGDAWIAADAASQGDPANFVQLR
jgi:hypothetical protein